MEKASNPSCLTCLLSVLMRYLLFYREEDSAVSGAQNGGLSGDLANNDKLAMIQ